MKTRDYVLPQPTDVACCTLRSWLRACDIQYTDTGNTTLTVCGLTDVQVAVVVEPIELPNTVVVIAQKLTQPDTLSALAEFWRVTEAAGLGDAHWPSERLTDHEGKLSYKTDPEMVAWRHKEFSRVPNMSKAQEEFYKPIISKAATYFYGFNRDWCRWTGFELEDIQTYAHIYATIYAGRYEVYSPTVNDNSRKCFAYLRQRLAEFRKIWSLKRRSITVDTETAKLGQYGELFEGKGIEYLTKEEAAEIQEGERQYAKKHRLSRKTNTAKFLRDALDKMDPQEVVNILQGIIDDNNYDKKTRKAAMRELNRRMGNEEEVSTSP